MNDDTLAACLADAVPGLRSAVMFGSCLSPTTRKPTSIPDLFALVDELDPALAALGVSALGRRVARRLPPATLALEAGGATVAKVNIATPAAVADALARLPDLSLAGRLSKKTRLVFHRDAVPRAELSGLLDGAATAMASTALMGLERRTALSRAAQRCFALSYQAELRPERQNQVDARYQAFAPEYQARFGAHLSRLAPERGIAVHEGHLVDERPERIRRSERRALAALLWRGRVRSLARWTREPLLYRGWFPYLVGKLRRAWA